MKRILLSTLLLFGLTLSAKADLIQVTITNTAPQNGTFLTPFFVGAHNGSFTLFTPGQTASAGLERLAEDGGPRTILINEITALGGVGGTAGMGPIAPGQTVSIRLDVDPAMQRFLTFGSMIIPSNDAFIGNPFPNLFPLFDSTGQLITRSGSTAINVTGAQVWDAGTEVNDEIPSNTAFLGQMAPNTGVTENGLVRLHAGFQGSRNLGGSLGNILSDSRFSNADFTQPGYQIASISVTAVPAPPAVLLAGMGVVSLWGMRKIRKNSTVESPTSDVA